MTALSRLQRLIFGSCHVFFLGAVIAMCAQDAGAATNFYNISRRFIPVAYTSSATPTAYSIVMGASNLTDIVRSGTNVVFDTNATYAVEYESVALGYSTPDAAWYAVTTNYSSNTQIHSNVVYDNAGWVKGTHPAYGTWGGFLWLLQNHAAFKTSPTNFWVSPSGVTNLIDKVLVGTVGDYPPVTNAVDVGPTNWNGDTPITYLGSGGKTDLVCQADFNTYYKLRLPEIGIAMDGDRDGSIIIGNTNDSHYLFWVNNDVDVISSGEEDDAASGTPNCNDNVITCKRDLEDFTRVHIMVDTNTVNLPNITYYLKFEGTSGTAPSVNIFEAINESTAYLSDTNIASQQILKTNLLTVTTTEHQLPNQFINTNNQVSPFILEGKSSGKGDLTLIVKKSGAEICRKSVRLELRSITNFYDKYVATISTGDNVNTGSTQVGTCTYTPENNEYVLHVHGWNMENWEKDRWTETVFKRLWWQGYKGHVGGFQWPTYTGTTTYDASEIRAWRSGEALKNRINAINASCPGQVRVIAHSMGNVVMGEALRLFSSSVVHTYIAAQAAIPAHCYDNTISNYWTGFNTPNIYSRYSSGLAPSTPYLATNSSHVGTMALYFNTQDYALSAWAWQLNNEMKPDLNYWNTDGDSSDDSYNPAAGDRFSFDNILVPFDDRTLVIPNDRFEIFARIVESRSRALGAVAVVSGFGVTRNLQNWGYDGAHYSHSREFRSNVANEWSFWGQFFLDADLSR